MTHTDTWQERCNLAVRALAIAFPGHDVKLTFDISHRDRHAPLACDPVVTIAGSNRLAISGDLHIHVADILTRHFQPPPHCLNPSDDGFRRSRLAGGDVTASHHARLAVILDMNQVGLDGQALLSALKRISN